MANVSWDQMQLNIEREVNRIGFEYLADKPVNDHPDDWYLRIVLGYRESDDSYATWLYNADLNGLFHGHYDMEQDIATQDFLERT